MNGRRAWLLGMSRMAQAGSALGALGAWVDPLAAPTTAATSTARSLQFPRDFGGHLDARIEWWYVTGELQSPAGREFGFQITFFRSLIARDGPRSAGEQPSSPAVATTRLAAHHLLFAHAALTDVHNGRLLHAERLSRFSGQSSPATVVSTEDTHLQLERWHLRRVATQSPAVRRAVTHDGSHDGAHTGSRYAARWDDVDAGFALDLDLQTTQAVLLQGVQGLSAKSPRPDHYSRYYSQPQLRVRGELRLLGQRQAVQGRAWLDHEWSSALLDPEAVGWDWVGLNLDDGAALTVFRLRRADGTPLFAGGSVRRPGGAVRAFAPQEVEMTPGRTWRSTATGAVYPVEWTLRTPAGRHTVRGVIDAQELDSRGSTGTVYWEGLSRVFDEGGARVGTGYLEMTGYAGRLRL